MLFAGRLLEETDKVHLWLMSFENMTQSMKPLTDSCAATLLGYMSCQNCMSAVPRALRVQILYRSPSYYYCFGSHASLFVLCVLNALSLRHKASL